MAISFNRHPTSSQSLSQHSDAQYLDDWPFRQHSEEQPRTTQIGLEEARMAGGMAQWPLEYENNRSGSYTEHSDNWRLSPVPGTYHLHQELPVTPPGRTRRRLQKERISRYADEFQGNDLRSTPLPSQHYKRQASFRRSPRSSQAYRSNLENGLQTIDERIQYSSFSETWPGAQSTPEAVIKTIWGGVSSPFRKVLSQYGKRQISSDLEEKTENITQEYPRGIRLFLILLSAALPCVVVVLDDGVIAIIVLQLVSEFHEPADIGWYASAYFLPQMVLMPLFGKCYSLWRVKWLFISALAIITVGSILCAIARTSAIFITGRALAGVGAAGIITGAMRIMALAAPRKYRVFLEAASAVILGACTVSGPIIGGVIANSIGWRWSFWVNIPIATVSIVIIFFFCPKGSASSVVLSLSVWEKVRRLDLVGGSLLISSLVCLTCALQLISSSTELRNSEKLLVIGAVVLLVAFLVHAKFISSEVSLTPRWLLSIRAVWSCCLGLIFLFATTINFIFFLAIYFQAVDGQSAEESAISLLPYAISVSVGAFITSLIVSKTRYYNPFFMFGGALLATGAGLTCTLDINTPSVTRTIYQSILGSGFGCLMLANVAACQTSLADEHHSIAQGLTFFSSLLGSTISLPVSSTIFNRILRMRVESLDIPLTFKRLIILDPATVREFIPTEYQKIALEALVYSIRRTFLLGLTCSIVCAVSFYLVPWIPIMSVSGAQQRGSVVPDSPPKLPPLSFIQDPEAERSWRWLSNSARVMSTSRSGTPISFMSSIPEGSLRIAPDPAHTP